jgi:putative flippase GtrA
MFTLILRLKHCLVGRTTNTALQASRAFVASVICTLVDMALLVALVELCGWPVVAAATLGYLVGTVVQFVLCSVWVFPNAARRQASGFVVFTLLSAVGLLITALVMAGLNEVAGINYALAKVAALGLSFSWNFLSRKWFLFTSPAADGSEPAPSAPTEKIAQPHRVSIFLDL